MIKAIDELAQRPQWVGWNYEGLPNPNTGKQRKVPKNPTTGGNAMPNTASTWASYQAAQAARTRASWAGVGFMFTAEDSYCGVDLDNCIDDAGGVSALAWRIIKLLDSYTEVSPSGRGVKIYCRGALLASLKIADIGAGIGLEMYSEGRYFAVTENHLQGTPDSINEAQGALDELYQQYQTSAPAMPTAPRPAPAGGPANHEYPLAWVKAIVDRAKGSAADMVATASDGYKHNARLKAGELLGGYIAGLQAIGYGFLLGEDEAITLVYESNPPASNQRGELDTISDAIAHGQQAPVEIPKPERAPIISAHGSPTATHSPAAAPSYAIPPVSLETLPELPAAAIIKQCLFEDESGDARLLRALYGDRLAYDFSAGAWYFWAGHYWSEDSTAQIRPLIEAHLGTTYLALATQLNAQAAGETDLIKKQDLLTLVGQLQKRANVLHKMNRQNTIENLARSYFAITGERWDAEPYLLAVANGVINLHTGQLEPGAPGQYLRKVAPTEYRGLDTPAPRWEQFLAELFEPGGPNAEIPAYLQRLFGYGVLGLVREAVLPVLYGPKGRNGKDTMLRAIADVLGPHADAMGNDVLISTGRGRDAGAASAHLVDLQGKRLVWASEPEDGQKFSVGQAKLLTGGGRINARAVYGKKNITFAPSHLMFLLTNHKPKAPSDDDAFWSRMQLIPFLYRFLEPHEYTGAPNERVADTGLGAKLASELPGILAWMVRGCLEYQRVGIQPPAIVQLATAEYRDDEDTFGDFLGECMFIGPAASVAGGPAYGRYKAWALENGHKPMSNKTFGKRLGERFTKARTSSGYIYRGVGLIDAVHSDQEPYTGDLEHSNGMDNQAVYGVYAKNGNLSKSENTPSHVESFRIYPTHHTLEDENSPLESDKTNSVGSDNDPTPVYGHTPQQADPPPSLLDQAATLIGDGQFDDYEALKARHPGYDWAGSTDQRASYKRWRSGQKV